MGAVSACLICLIYTFIYPIATFANDVVPIVIEEETAALPPKSVQDSLESTSDSASDTLVPENAIRRPHPTKLIEGEMDVFKKYEYYKPDKASMKKGVVNLKQGEVFLAKNKTEPGVIELENGIQYKVLKEGRGPLPKLEDVVGCIYKATLIDGTVFESSKGRPVQISIAPLIPGLASMLTTMHVGSRYSIVIPAPLAFRDKGKKPLVGPNSIVIYDVELIDIVPAATNKKHAT